MILAAGRADFEELASTQDEAMARFKAGQPVGVVWTRHQSAGRGRRDRSWWSTPGDSLTMSLTVIELPPQVWLVGMAVAAALSQELDLSLKWPNDLILEGRKVGGILTEAAAGAAVVGVGINVSQTAFPDGLDAISLRQAGVEFGDVRTLSSRLVKAVTEFPTPACWSDIASLWSQRDETTGRRYLLPDGRTGTATGIDGSGRLLLKTERGVEAVEAGVALS